MITSSRRNHAFHPRLSPSKLILSWARSLRTVISSEVLGHHAQRQWRLQQKKDASECSGKRRIVSMCATGTMHRGSGAHTRTRIPHSKKDAMALTWVTSSNAVLLLHSKVFGPSNHGTYFQTSSDHLVAVATFNPLTM